MIELHKATIDDVPAFVAMEQAMDTTKFIVPYSRAKHERNISDPSLVYLKIIVDGVLAGFFILCLDVDGRSVEFRRIVVADKGRGVGQLAITQMENFCRTHLGRKRIWLDVFEYNQRGRHIYEKLGYEKFGETDYGSGRLWLYEKML
jgi:RimJ/RimL family protein N-acetyltransferase